MHTTDVPHDVPVTKDTQLNYCRWISKKGFTKLFVADHPQLSPNFSKNPP
jgi:hypothetical protein